MDPLGGLAFALLQDGSLDALQHDVHLQMIWTMIIGIVLLIFLLGLLIAGVAALMAVKKAQAMLDRVEGKAMPVIDKTHALIDQLTPKIHKITENVEQMSYTVRGKVDEIGVTVTEINKTVQDINGKTREKVTRVNGMVDDALTTTQHVSRTIQDGVRKPVQQIAGIVAGIKAAVEKLIERSPFGHRERHTPYEGSRTYERESVYESAAAASTETEPVRPKAPAGPFKRPTPYDV